MLEVNLFKIFGEGLTVESGAYLYGSISMEGMNNTMSCYQYLSTHPQATTTTIVCEDNASLYGNFSCDVYMNGDNASYAGNCLGDVYLIGESSSNLAAPALIEGTLYCIGKYTANFGQANYGVFSGEGSCNITGIYVDATFSGVGSYNQGGSYIYGNAVFSGTGAYNLGVCDTVTFSGEDSYSGVGSYATTAVYCGLRSRNLGWIEANAYFSGVFSENESLDGYSGGAVQGNSYAYAGSGKTGNRDIGGIVVGDRLEL
jgi:hypothetical protein